MFTGNFKCPFCSSSIDEPNPDCDYCGGKSETKDIPRPLFNALRAFRGPDPTAHIICTTASTTSWK